MNLNLAIYRQRLVLLYGLLCAVGVSCALATMLEPGIWLTRAGLLADIAGLLQLEVSGVLDLIHKAALEREDRGENIPSSFVREIIDVPVEDRTFKDTIDCWLQRSPKAGILMIGVGCLLQLVATFFV